jgi:rubrerythrin
MGLFHIAEVVDLGIEKEKKRRDFYAAAAAQFRDAELRTLFTQLRDWEEAHIKKFTEIRDTLDEGETAESYSGELDEYMKVLISEKLYQDVSPGAFSKNVTSIRDAIYYGIEFEKDAILFFSELANYASGSHREIIQKLIDEEKQHIVFLALLQQKITAGEKGSA